MIFEDPSARRGRFVRAAGLALAVAAFVALGVVALSVVTPPTLPSLPPALQSTTPGGDAVVVRLDDAADAAASAPPSQAAEASSSGALSIGAKAAPASAPAAAPSLGGSEFLNAAFLLQDEQISVASLRAHLKNLQIVFPDWMSFADASGALIVKVDRPLADQIRAAGAKLLPRVANIDANGEWFESGLGDFLRSAAAAAFRDRLLATLAENKADGVNIDIESLHPQDEQAYVDWLERLTNALHDHGYLVTVDVPMNDEAYDYQAIGRIADAVVLMAYDEHWSTGGPGPIASRPWYQDGLDQAAERIDPDKLIVGVGGYAYDWTEGGRAAEALEFEEALALADSHNAPIEAGADDVNSHFHYVDEARRNHDVWMLDAISAWNEYLYARRAGVRGAALWRTGPEDPQLWSFFGAPNAANFDPRALAHTPAIDTVRIEGKGELLRVDEGRRDGVRNFAVKDGFIDWARYERLPRSFKLQRFGGDIPPKRIALTFDDGPHPIWTPQVLSVLAKYGAPATFFLIGENVERAPQLVRDELAAGNLIGNHTYTHPDLTAISNPRLWVEATFGQRQIEAAAGRSTLLFRPPYDTDSQPRSAAQLAPLEQLDGMGYLIAGADIDSTDYDRPGVDAIFNIVMHDLVSTGGHIIVFHDGGGDRSQTVAALDRLIPALREAGYEIVPLNDLIGVSAATLNPELSQREELLSLGARIPAWARTSGAEILVYLFALTTGIAILRILFLGALVARDWRRRASDPAEPFEPPVCVLIPAYNEATVIGRTIEAALASDYRSLRILVIDDGSADDTASVVEAWAERDPRVALVRQRNGGKASALNRAARVAEEEILVTIDADTLVLRHTISSLVKPLADPSVDAVCGNVQVGNVCNLLTAFQSVEYVTSQNYDRRAFDSLNCISVVPGATGAWRRRTLLAVGGYSADTLTEDADLTLTILGAGGRITYAPLAQSITEAPQTVASLFRQRFRWSYGTLQCLWKHRRNFGRGALGWVALPNVAMFQLLFPLLAPLGDFIFLLALLRLDFRPVAVGYATFLALDLVASLVAFRLDRRPLREIWVVVVQRFVYRPFLYVVTFSVVLAALRGARQRWNKLARTGAVDAGRLEIGLETPAE